MGQQSPAAQGFTLIELMVVVAIIGILISIALPAFSQYRERGYDASARSDARNFLNQAILHSEGHQGP